MKHMKLKEKMTCDIEGCDECGQSYELERSLHHGMSVRLCSLHALEAGLAQSGAPAYRFVNDTGPLGESRVESTGILWCQSVDFSEVAVGFRSLGTYKITD